MSFKAVIEHAKEVLSHYVKRRGDNVPVEFDDGGCSRTVAHGKGRRSNDSDSCMPRCCTRCQLATHQSSLWRTAASTGASTKVTS